MCKRISATGGGNAHASCKGATLLTGSIPPHRPAALRLAGQQHHPSPAGSIILPRQLAASHLAGQQHPTLPAGSIPHRQPAASHLTSPQHPTTAIRTGTIPARSSRQATPQQLKPPPLFWTNPGVRLAGLPQLGWLGKSCAGLPDPFGKSLAAFPRLLLTVRAPRQHKQAHVEANSHLAAPFYWLQRFQLSLHHLFQPLTTHAQSGKSSIPFVSSTQEQFRSPPS